MKGNDALLAVIRALEESGIDYMIVGSYSSNTFGLPRSTKDADIVMAPSSEALRDFRKRLPPEIVFDSQVSFEAITNTRRHVLSIRGAVFKVELFILSDDAFDQVRFRRRNFVDLPIGFRAMLQTAEDVVVQKIRWYNDGARTREVLERALARAAEYQPPSV